MKQHLKSMRIVALQTIAGFALSERQEPASTCTENLPPTAAPPGPSNRIPPVYNIALTSQFPGELLPDIIIWYRTWVGAPSLYSSNAKNRIEQR